MEVRERVLTVEQHYSQKTFGESVFSRIRLKGKWLREAGFEPSDKVVVKPVASGKIIIEKEEA